MGVGVMGGGRNGSGRYENKPIYPYPGAPEKSFILKMWEYELCEESSD